ncbi:uncharacterized protein C8Q71DRAFT_799953 [Rhodofomes roseus]|uniref:Transposase-associated domain-containing protein n=1 Tax=Rhodofomes roseus TaxID=34475 RepID=A0ABQ8JYP3_9APHY|nr:uncharacterized protein C8Q71DRAFT_799953 [Rhodofomes roseus]KAH9828716.1 hypothetical protein C8Q71DRAFT_799953 [Rhodofomes roseus]
MQLFKWNGHKWVRFRHEPWTADLIWEAQSVLPEGGTPFAFVVYADKTKLSSFGTQKGYPVMARCAQLPIEIRNGNGIGGGAVVGWLPVVDEGTAEEGKKDFVDFKRVVWHKAFYEFCRKIEALSKTGYQCSIPNIDRLFFPIMSMIVADYEEQCVMALIRGGHQSLCNCPRCLAKKKGMASLGEPVVWRTPENTQEVLALAHTRPAGAKEGLLKDYGLRDILNVFWRFMYTNVYRALGFDKLHGYGLGLFGDHIWPAIVAIIKIMGRDGIAKVDDQTNAFPVWRNLCHFKHVVNINFNDGSKFEDLSKITPYVVHNVIATEQGSEGYLLLGLLRKYLELDMYYSFTIQTEDTIAAIRGKLFEFSDALQKLQDKTGPDGKNWDFPKMHAHQHGPKDIEDKGATRNYNTKPFEKMHGSLKKSYLRRSNKRNVESQILTAEHDLAVMQIMRANIEDYDAYKNEEEEDEEYDADNKPIIKKKGPSSRLSFDKRIFLGAPEKPITIAELATSDSVAKDLHLQLNDLLEHVGPKSKDGENIKVGPHDQIVEYRFLKVNYQSEETWKQDFDLLRCTPSWFGKERRDHILLNTEDGHIFARLMLIFTYSVDGIEHPFIVVRPLDGAVEPEDRDKDLGFYRVRQSEYDLEVHPAQSIIRGALIIRDHDNIGDHFAVDIDPDMFCRLNTFRARQFL